MFILKLGEHFKIPASTSYPLAVYYLLILCTPLLYITYFRFGLIESFATLLLLATMYLATQQRMKLMALTGALTLLLRLDYLGITTAAFVLTSTELLGALRQAWQGLLAWLSTRWKVFAEYLATLIMLPTLIIAGYFVFIPGYYLNASDTQQTSLTSVIESMARVIIRGTSPELVRDFAAHPADVVLISAPLAIGFLLALGALLVRRGLWSRIDMRLALLIPSLLPAYLVVRPAAYFPRFSLPLLPLDLLLIALVFQHILRERRRTSEPE